MFFFLAAGSPEIMYPLVRELGPSRASPTCPLRRKHALAWAAAGYEKAAHDLWVDDEILDVPLASLTPRERAHLDEQLATILI